MNDHQDMQPPYSLRCTPEDYDDMVKMGITLGAIAKAADGTIYTTHPAGMWDHVGPVPKPTGEIDSDGNPVMAPVKDGNGKILVHVNLLTDVDLRKAALALAADHPKIAAGLADLSRFFVTDAQGNAVAPKNPYRVFAT